MAAEKKEHEDSKKMQQKKEKDRSVLYGACMCVRSAVDLFVENDIFTNLLHITDLYCLRSLALPSPPPAYVQRREEIKFHTAMGKYMCKGMFPSALDPVDPTTTPPSVCSSLFSSQEYLQDSVCQPSSCPQ